jgi:hypothetical protein
VPPVPHPSLDDRRSVRLQVLALKILRDAGEDVDNDSDSSEEEGPVMDEYGDAYEDMEDDSRYLLGDVVDTSDEYEDEDGVD